jgi:hypothetical protein
MAIVENLIVNSNKYFIFLNILFEILPVYHPESANGGRFFGPRGECFLPGVAGAAAGGGSAAE